MNTHQLRLATAPFEAIVSGDKVIESRLYDDKRQLIQLGDTIEFTNRESPNQKVAVRVIGLLRYNTFHDLYTRNSPKKFGSDSAEWLEDQVNEFYSIEDQAENGVVGIEFEIV